MSTSRLQSTINRYRSELARRELRAEHELIRAYTSILARINPMLNELYRQIDEKQQAGEQVPLSWLYERNRLNALKLYITGQVDHFGSLALMATGHMQAQSAALGQQAGLELLRAMLPPSVHYSFGMPSHDAIIGLIGATQSGSPLADLFNGFGQEAANAVAQALITGLSLGHNPLQTAPLVKDALNIPLRRARTICCQEQLRCYKSANLETFRANSRVCQQWRWQAARQARTCVVCIAMDGSLHDLSEEFESHIRCRCCPVPVTKSWEELLSPLGIDASGIPETSYTPTQTGVQWFEDQDEQTQRKIIGSDAAYELYSSGQITLHDFVGVKRDSDWGTSRYQRSVKQIMKRKNIHV